jgi:hypothetical protein
METSTANDIVDLGVLGGNYYNYAWVEHNANTNLFYVLPNGYNAGIKSYSATDYFFKNDINFDDIYYATVNGTVKPYEVKPFYLFSNQAGNQLYILRNIISSEDIAWSLEILSI